VIGSSWKIEPTIERQGKQQRERQPRADLLISGHSLNFRHPDNCVKVYSGHTRLSKSAKEYFIHSSSLDGDEFRIAGASPTIDSI
jgi:hypothetical protein